MMIKISLEQLLVESSKLQDHRQLLCERLLITSIVEI